MKVVTLDGLKKYDELLKNKIEGGSWKLIDTITFDGSFWTVEKSLPEGTKELALYFVECGDNCQSRDPVNLTINDGEYTEQLSFFKFENGEVNSGNTQIHQYTRDEFIGQMTHEQRGGGSDGAEKLSYRKTSPLNWYPTAITSFKLQCYSSAICLQSGELRIYVK